MSKPSAKTLSFDAVANAVADTGVFLTAFAFAVIDAVANTVVAAGIYLAAFAFAGTVGLVIATAFGPVVASFFAAIAGMAAFLLANAVIDDYYARKGE